MSEHIIKGIFQKNNSKKANLKLQLENAFKKEDANTLSPESKQLFDKLDGNLSIVEGERYNRRSPKETNNIRTARQDATAVDLSVVKNQISDELPHILAQMGLKDKIDASLIVDMLVPSRINAPIHDTSVLDSVLRETVAECASKMDFGQLMKREGAIVTHSKGFSKKAELQAIIKEGVKRVGGDVPYSRLVKKADLQDATVDKQPENPEDASALPMAQSRPLHEQLAEILLEELISPEQATPKENPLQEGIVPIGEGEDVESEPQNLDDMGLENRVKRLDTAAPVMAFSRKPIYKQIKMQKPKDAHLFSFAGKLTHAPVEFVKLAAHDKEIISSHQALNYFTAAYSDSSTKTWKFYATDKGFLLLSNDGAYHTQGLKKFADFIEGDPSFRGWNAFPDEANMQEESNPIEEAIEKIEEAKNILTGQNDAPQDEIPSVEEPHSEENPIGEGVPEIKEESEEGIPEIKKESTVEHVEKEEPKESESDEKEEKEAAKRFELLSKTAESLLPKIASMFPNDSAEAQSNMAIEAAIHILTKEAADFGNSIMPGIADNIGKNVKGPLGPALTQSLTPKPANIGKPNVHPAIQQMQDRLHGAKPKDQSMKSLKIDFHHPDEQPKQPNQPAPQQSNALHPQPMQSVRASLSAMPSDKRRMVEQMLSQMHNWASHSDANEESKRRKNFMNQVSTLPGVSKEMVPHTWHNDWDAATAPKPLIEKDEKPLFSDEELHEPQHQIAASQNGIDEILHLSSDIPLEDFDLYCEGLLELGYDMNLLVQAAEIRYAGNCSDFDDKDSRMEKHIEHSEEESGKSEEEAKSIGIATVRKHKNEG